MHRVPASGSFGAFWFVRSGGGGCRLWFGSLPALPEWPDDDCGGLTQAAPKQGGDAAGKARNESDYLSGFCAYLSAAAILCRRFLSLPEIWEAKRHRQETRGNAKVQKFEVLPCGRFSSLSEISEAKRNRQETRNFENFEERDEKWSHSMAAADK